MFVIANGFPKSGTHALEKACFLLGVHCELGHYSYRMPMKDECTHHIFIRRDPRSIIVSKLREQGLPVTQGAFLSRFRRFEMRSLREELSEFAPWLKHAPLVVQYERLVSDDGEMRRIADYLGVSFLDDAWPNLPGHTRTWRLPHSDFAPVWTATVREAWEREGGYDLLKEWGYV